MTTKEDTLFSKNKHSNFSNTNSSVIHDSQQYSNLNLNQVYKNCSNVSFVQSTNKSNNDKQFAVVFIVTDSTVSHNNEKGNQKTNFLNKSSILSSPLISSSNFPNDKVKNHWMNDSTSAQNANSSNNNSTLSLHITAYENSVEANGDDSFDEMKKEKQGSIKNWKNAKQIFAAATKSANHASFEIPRQHQDQITEPEVAQFKASQRLLNPNQSTASNSVGSGNAPLAQLQQQQPFVQQQNSSGHGLAVSLSPVSETIKTARLPSPKFMKNVMIPANGLQLSSSGENLIPHQLEKLFVRREGFLYNLVTIKHQKGRKFGLGINYYHNKVIVTRVDEYSWAIDGFCVGDCILVINGEAVSDKGVAREVLLQCFQEGIKVLVIVERATHLEDLKCLFLAAFEQEHKKNIQFFFVSKYFHGFVKDDEYCCLTKTGEFYLCYSFGRDCLVHFYLVLATDSEDGLQIVKHELYFNGNRWIMGRYRFKSIAALITEVEVRKGLKLDETDSSSMLLTPIIKNVLSFVAKDGQISHNLKITKVNEEQVHNNFNEIVNKAAEDGTDLTLWAKRTDVPSVVVASDIVEICARQNENNLKSKTKEARSILSKNRPIASRNVSFKEIPVEHLIGGNDGKPKLSVPKKKSASSTSMDRSKKVSKRKGAGG